ncbi:hypothetical protein ACFLQN_02765 [Candidatus Aenigmatarchaeota archaeon]
MEISKKGNKSKINRGWFIAITLIMVILIVNPAYAQFTFEHPGCSLDQLSVCTILTECNLDLTCTDTETNCEMCEVERTQCPDGNVAVCQNYCEEGQFGTSAGCTACTPVCGDGPSIPTIILPFDVLLLKPLDAIVEPVNRNVPLGGPASYVITIQNRNPFPVNIASDVNVPEGWTHSDLGGIQIGANGFGEVAVTVTSPADISEGVYPINMLFLTPDIRSPLNVFSLSFTYTASDFQTHFVSSSPTSQQGLPGEKLTYNINIKNNDPPGFPASSFELSALLPEGWDVLFSDLLPRIEAQETKTVEMDLTSPEDSEETSFAINFDVKRDSISQESSVTYVVSYCGDQICDPGEDSSCEADCPSDQFICGGRCERQVDDGIKIRTSLQGITQTKFIVCNNDASTTECENGFDTDNCGFGNDCLCGDMFSTECSVKCVDEKGAYYMMAKDIGGEKIRSTSYSYICPFVDLPDIITLRDDFDIAYEEYERARSVLEERIAEKIEMGEDPVDLQPCFDGLGLIIDIVSNFVGYLDEVVENPALSNTTEAREKIVDISRDVTNLYTSFCLGATGLLSIQEIYSPEPTEIGREATTNIIVKNLGNVNYYGYASCAFKSPSMQQTEIRDSCTYIGGFSEHVFSPSVQVNEEGAWEINCNVYGSLNEQCGSPAIHDVSDPITFSVYSRDAFVQSVSGECNIGQPITCLVDISSQSSCGRCAIGGVGCTFLGQNGNTLQFECPSFMAVEGNVILTGSVFETHECAPVAPREKSTEIRCD